MSSYGYKSHVLMIFNQLTSYVEDVLKSYICNEILLVFTSINFYSLCSRCRNEVVFNHRAQRLLCWSINFFWIENLILDAYRIFFFQMIKIMLQTHFPLILEPDEFSVGCKTKGKLLTQYPYTVHHKIKLDMGEIVLK